MKERIIDRRVEIETAESIAKRKGMKEEDLARMEKRMDGMEGEEWLRYVAKVWRLEEWAAKKNPCEISLPDNVCVTGSLYLCGDFLDLVHYHFRVYYKLEIVEEW